MTVSISPPNQWARCYLKDRANHLPGRAGVYAIFDKQGHLYYIGMAKNLTNRWSGTGHHRYHQAVETIQNPILAWQVVDGRSVQSIETALIRKYKPDWNNTAPYKQRSSRKVTQERDHYYVEPDSFFLERLFHKVAIMLPMLIAFAFWTQYKTQSPSQYSSVAPATTAIHAYPNGPVIARFPAGAKVKTDRCDRGWVEVEWNGIGGAVPVSEFEGQDVCR